MGRRPSYDVNDVLRSATALFRKQGFHNVSVEDVVDATGLNRFALYEKFGGKEGLFYATLDFYYDILIHEELLGPLRADGACVDSILAMLTTISELNSDLSCRSGCLIVNANIELDGTDERVANSVETVIRAFSVAIAHALRCAESRGHLAPGRAVKDRIEHAVIQIQAFFALAYISREAAGRLLAGLADEVASWHAVPFEASRRAPAHSTN